MSPRRKIWWVIPHEGDGDAGAGAGAGAGDAGATTPPVTKTFTQSDVDKIIKERLDRQNKQSRSMIDELDALKAKSQLTVKERQELEDRIESMKNEHLTKEELADKKRSQMERQYKTELEGLTSERDAWKGRYTGSTISRSLTDAAVENDAYTPEQIVAILQSTTSLVEMLDEDGKPTGELTPKVKFNDINKEGKPVTLELSPKEAVKRMTEIDRYLNLFKGKATGGLGGSNGSGGSGKEPTANDLAKDPKKYREARDKGLLNFD